MKSFVPTLLVLVLFLAMSSSVAATPFQAVRNLRRSGAHSTADNIATIPRGGGGGPLLDSDIAQKLFVGTYGANAAVCSLATPTAFLLYGMSRNAATERLMQSVGAVGMSQALMLYLQVFQNVSFEKALGWSTWPFALTSLYQALIAKSDATIEFPITKHVPSCLLGVVVFYASQTEASWAGSLNKFYSYWILINALPMLFFPAQTAKVWQVSLKSEQATFMYRNLGYFLLTHGLSVVVQTMPEGTVAAAIGWSAAAVVASLLGLVATGQFKVAGIPSGPTTGWIALLAVIAQSLLTGQPPKGDM